MLAIRCNGSEDSKSVVRVPTEMSVAREGKSRDFAKLVSSAEEPFHQRYLSITLSVLFVPLIRLVRSFKHAASPAVLVSAGGSCPAVGCKPLERAIDACAAADSGPLQADRPSRPFVPAVLRWQRIDPRRVSPAQVDQLSVFRRTVRQPSCFRCHPCQHSFASNRTRLLVPTGTDLSSADVAAPVVRPPTHAYPRRSQ